jgi:hypothetical protein
VVEKDEGPEFFHDPEQRNIGERCIIGMGSTSGPPMLSTYYNNLKQIVQTPTHVMILVEMIHDARIIRLDDKHLPPSIRSWMGDSIGRWDGDTLVVETTNFTGKTRFRGSSDQLKVTERFRRVSDDTLVYHFTVEDPATWTRPWSGEYQWKKTTDLIYEYACHEGNFESRRSGFRGYRLLEKEQETRRAGERKSR